MGRQGGDFKLQKQKQQHQAENTVQNKNNRMVNRKQQSHSQHRRQNDENIMPGSAEAKNAITEVSKFTNQQHNANSVIPASHQSDKIVLQLQSEQESQGPYMSHVNSTKAKDGGHKRTINVSVNCEEDESNSIFETPKNQRLM